MAVSIQILKGAEIRPYVHVLAEMRMREFYNFPYLYVGNTEEEIQFSAGYPNEKDSILLLVFDDDRPVGLCSGIPFSSTMEFIQEMKQHAHIQGVDLEEAYYLGEIIIEKEHRKMGTVFKAGKQFFDEVQKMRYKRIAGITAIRPEDHPLRPQDYRDTDKIWPRMGFQKTSAILSFDYSTRQADGSIRSQENPMALWVKKID